MRIHVDESVGTEDKNNNKIKALKSESQTRMQNISTSVKA